MGYRLFRRPLILSWSAEVFGLVLVGLSISAFLLCLLEVVFFGCVCGFVGLWVCGSVGISAFVCLFLPVCVCLRFYCFFVFVCFPVVVLCLALCFVCVLLVSVC